jgi:hypothetical protein
MATNEEKAKMYNQLLREYDVKAREVSILKSKFDLTKAEEKQIKVIKEEMDLIQRKAMNLGSL